MILRVYEAPKDPGRTKKVRDTIRVRVPSGQPRATVNVTSGCSIGLVVKWFDAFDLPEVHCRLQMSRIEAAELRDALSRVLEE